MELTFEMIGVAGTLFVLASFLMKDYRKTRLINVVGSILFVVYGFLIGAVSTWLLNGLLIIINIYFLVKDDNGDRGKS